MASAPEPVKKTCSSPGGATPVRAAAASGTVTVEAPEGTVTVDGDTQHVHKTARIGRIGGDGAITEVWSSPEPIEPDPFLTGYDWAADLSAGARA